MKHWDAILSVTRTEIAGDPKKARAYVKMLVENIGEDEAEFASDLRRELYLRGLSARRRWRRQSQPLAFLWILSRVWKHAPTVIPKFGTMAVFSSR